MAPNTATLIIWTFLPDDGTSPGARTRLPSKADVPGPCSIHAQRTGCPSTMPGQPANVNSLSESYDSLISVVFVGSQHQGELATVIDLGDLHLD
ncbi:hypothetical protein EV30_14930, partial [Staphylococcus aureus]